MKLRIEIYNLTILLTLARKQDGLINPATVTGMKILFKISSNTLILMEDRKDAVNFFQPNMNMARETLIKIVMLLDVSSAVIERIYK